MLNKNFELTDEDLNDVSGGLMAPVTGRRFIKTCDDFLCVWCGRRKATATEEEHICASQGNAIFSNVCDECEHLYTCPRANSWEGLGSPTASNG